MNYLIKICSKIIIITTIISLVLLLSCNQKSTRKKIDLNSGWEFFYEKTNKWYPAKIPGNIHTDLFANGLISDPLYGSNSDSLTWISEKEWKYRKEFDLSPDFINRNLELVFDGIDTHSEVFLNGEKIGVTSNMFRQWVFVIDDSIRKKQNNLIEVVFYPSSLHNSERQNAGIYSIPDNRTHTRKAQYQYGWDFAPNMETCGIYKDVYINSWEKLRIKNIFIEQKLVSDTAAILVAYIEIESENFYNGDVKIISPNHEFDSLNQKLKINEGIQTYPVEFVIKRPELWWCNGYGNQKLYEIQVEVSTKFRVETKTIKTGIRKIELCTDTDKDGQKFYFILNGQPIFARGANWVPAEFFNGSNTDKKYEELLTLAKDANFNMLRVWGGGIYENDYFYSLCDSLGIMIWQDFMFSCAMYPIDDKMIENIKEEVKYQTTRLYNHPSIAMYCGNNEISNGWFDWNWQQQYNISNEDSVKIWKDYDNLFHRIIPSVVADIDKSKAYIPSSPSFGWGHAESITHGDSHYWGVWWGEEEFDIYFDKTGRFMSEYGFQSIPEMNSLMNFIPEDSLYRYSQALKNHQKHKSGFYLISKYMEHTYPIPEQFEDYIYISQIVQAEGMQKAFDAHISAMPYCMGTLFWQFNDCWPAISWSAVDYYNQPKALYYYAKRSFENVSISAYEHKNKFHINLINHNNYSFITKLIISINDFNGKLIMTDTTVLISDLLSSTPVEFENNITDSIAKYRNKSFVRIKLFDNNTEDLLSSRIVVPGKNYNLLLPKQELTYNAKLHKDYFEISLTSKVFIKDLYISTENIDGKFSDNYFNLIPGENRTIFFYPSEKTNKLKLKFKSMNQIINDILIMEAIEEDYEDVVSEE
ncbi:MAG: hypothetical protein PHH30_06780 [Bacteroidales bacterium]|nr:hypothetical protein [Bacteroidales bacterium]